MHVVATAGHVDHGKSTLVRALTGMEPDRWAEEKRRGLTIDLGFAWTALPSGAETAFVDVPGHERFLGNMLAGLGPTPVVCVVVAADEGWQAQSGDHRDAIAALGIHHGLIVVTKADRAPDRVEETLAQARAELAGTGLREAPAVVVSAATGAGLHDLRDALDDLLDQVPPPPSSARVRLWVDRAFSIKGAGTVVTGTLPAGTLTKGDRLALVTRGGAREVTVRSLQRHGEGVDAVGPVSRVAVNLRGLDAGEVGRGDALVTPGAWWTTAEVDVRRVSGPPLDDVPEQLVAHVGSAAVPVRLRPFGGDHARITLSHGLPLALGDRFVLRVPGSRGVLGGVVALDVEPPALRRRGDGRRRAEGLAALPVVGDAVTGDAAAEVARRGAVRAEHLVRLGLPGVEPANPPAGVRQVGSWWVDEAALRTWAERLGDVVARHHERDPLSPGLTTGAAADALALPDETLLPEVVDVARLEADGRHVRAPGRGTTLGPSEASVRALEERLREHPFAAPEVDELAALGLGPRELAAAERVGRLLRLDGAVVLLPTAPALAMRELARLAQPFTTSEARQALGVTRRVAIPLLEHLDGRGWTRRVDGSHREVVRG